MNVLSGMTQSHSFTVERVEGKDKPPYRARIDAFFPAVAQFATGMGTTPMQRQEEPIYAEGDSLDELRENSLAAIAEKFGAVLNWIPGK